MQRASAEGQYPRIAFEQLGLNLLVNNMLCSHPSSSQSCSDKSVLYSNLAHKCYFNIMSIFLSCMFMLFATVFFLSVGEGHQLCGEDKTITIYSVLLLYIFRISFQCQDSDCLKAAGALFQCILYIFRNQINADNYLVY